MNEVPNICKYDFLKGKPALSLLTKGQVWELVANAAPGKPKDHQTGIL
jgi:hypothetical protein